MSLAFVEKTEIPVLQIKNLPDTKARTNLKNVYIHGNEVFKGMINKTLQLLGKKAALTEKQLVQSIKHIMCQQLNRSIQSQNDLFGVWFTLSHSLDAAENLKKVNL